MVVVGGGGGGGGFYDVRVHVYMYMQCMYVLYIERYGHSVLCTSQEVAGGGMSHPSISLLRGGGEVGGGGYY